MEERKKTTITIHSDVYNEYKELCFEQGVPVGLPLELLMKNFIEGTMDFLFDRDSQAPLTRIGIRLREDLLRDLREKCRRENLTVPVALEAFMTFYINCVDGIDLVLK